MKKFAWVLLIAAVLSKITSISDQVSIPLGGNAYRTAGTVGSVSGNGLTNWTSADTVFSAYFRINTPGNLNLYLNATISAASMIKVTYAGIIKKIDLRPQRSIHQIGSIKNCPLGYLKVDFQGISKEGRQFALPYSIIVNGTAATDINYVHNTSFYWGRRGPSVHLQYILPLSERVYARWFYNQLTVPIGSDIVGSYFMSNGFRGGYFGIQVNSLNQRKVLFSIWDGKSNNSSQVPFQLQVRLIQAGDNVTIKRFGGEGSGGQSYWLYNWTAGTTYKFLTKVQPNTTINSTEFVSYFSAPQIDGWKLIARWQRPKTMYNYEGAYSFLENFNKNNGYIERSFQLGNQWVYTTQNRWVEVTKAKFTFDGTGRSGVRRDYDGGLKGNKFYLKNCGFFNTINTEYGKNFSRPATKLPPIDSFR